jgi:hypothetical protein
MGFVYNIYQGFRAFRLNSEMRKCTDTSKNPPIKFSIFLIEANIPKHLPTLNYKYHHAIYNNVQYSIENHMTIGLWQLLGRNEKSYI